MKYLAYILIPFLIGFLASIVINQPTEKPATIDTNSRVFQIKYTQNVCRKMHNEVGPTPNYSECARMQEVTNTDYVCNEADDVCWLVDK